MIETRSSHDCMPDQGPGLGETEFLSLSPTLRSKCFPLSETGAGAGGRAEAFPGPPVL